MKTRRVTWVWWWSAAVSHIIPPACLHVWMKTFLPSQHWASPSQLWRACVMNYPTGDSHGVFLPWIWPKQIFTYSSTPADRSSWKVCIQLCCKNNLSLIRGSQSSDTSIRTRLLTLLLVIRAWGELSSSAEIFHFTLLPSSHTIYFQHYFKENTSSGSFISS